MACARDDDRHFQELRDAALSMPPKLLEMLGTEITNGGHGADVKATLK